MYRCMTCDKRKAGQPTLVELNEAGEAIGLCPECVVIVRSFNTFKAQAAGEYETDSVAAKEARAIAKSIVGPAHRAVFITPDSPVEIHPNEVGPGRHAWVAAKVYVELGEDE